jgi:hypothetical protein
VVEVRLRWKGLPCSMAAPQIDRRLRRRQDRTNQDSFRLFGLRCGQILSSAFPCVKILSPLHELTHPGVAQEKILYCCELTFVNFACVSTEV